MAFGDDTIPGSDAMLRDRGSSAEDHTHEFWIHAYYFQIHRAYIE